MSNPASSSPRTLLVTGAAGHLGRRVAELLLDRRDQGSPDRIVITTRSPDKVADLAARGAQVRRADFDDRGSLIDAFAGVDRVLLISTDALDRPGHRLAQHRTAIDAAVAAGVGHVVYTSLLNPGPSSPVSIAPDHHGTEQALAACGLDYTSLRNNLYIDLQLGALPRAIATGQLVTAAGDGAASYVTRDDCARVAAAALAATTTGRNTIDITGPAAITQAELARLASELAGRPVAHVPVPPEALRAGMIDAGLPAPVAELLVSFDVAIARGDLSTVSSAVADLTGRAPTSVAEFLAAHRAALQA